MKFVYVMLAVLCQFTVLPFVGVIAANEDAAIHYSNFTTVTQTQMASLE